MLQLTVLIIFFVKTVDTGTLNGAVFCKFLNRLHKISQKFYLKLQLNLIAVNFSACIYTHTLLTLLQLSLSFLAQS